LAHGSGTVADMKVIYTRLPMQRTLRETRKALDDLGAEPLEGSGFEDETPEPEFSDTDAAHEPRR
jgi:hypothetical protein